MVVAVVLMISPPPVNSLVETVLEGIDLPEKDCVVRLLDGIWNCDVLSTTKDWKSAMAVLPWILETYLHLDEASKERGGDSSSSSALSPFAKSTSSTAVKCPNIEGQRAIMETTVNVFLYLLRTQSPETMKCEQ